MLLEVRTWLSLMGGGKEAEEGVGVQSSIF